MAASRSAQIPRRRLLYGPSAAARKRLRRLVCLYAGSAGRSIAAAAQEQPGLMDAPRSRHLAPGNRRHRRRAARPDPPPRSPGRRRSPPPSRPGGLALRPGREARVMRQAAGDARRRPSRRRGLSHVARDDERLHADADAGPQDRDLPPGRPARLLGSRARPFRLPDPVRRPRHAGRRCWRRCAPARPRSASCRRRSKPIPRRGGRCSPAGTRPCPTSWPACPSSSCPTRGARGISAFVLARIEPEASGDDRALIAVEAQERPQPRPHCRRPGQGRPAAPSPRRWTRLWPACITISSSCRA